MSSKYICVVAGGSGGHLIPGLELAQQWVKEHPGYQIMLLTTTKKIDDTVVRQYSQVKYIKRFQLPVASLRKPWMLPMLALKTLIVFAKGCRVLWSCRPTRIISTGGLISIPVACAAKVVRIPFDLYELNAVPGKAARVLAPLSTHIYVTFLAAQKYFSSTKCSHKTYPVRFAQTDVKAAVRDVIGLSKERKTIFLLGGSQGSVQLNLFLKQFIEVYPELHQSMQVIHQTGAFDTTDWNAFYRKKNIPAIVFSYTHQIKQYYRAADVVVTRAGAGTLFELLFFKKKSLVVPLQAKTTSHQKDNAQAMAQEYPELFRVVSSENFNEHLKFFF